MAGAVQIQPAGRHRGHTRSVYTLCPSHVEGHFFSAGSEGVIAHWNVNEEAGEALATFSSPVFSLCLDAPRGRLIAGLQNGEIHFIDLASKKILHSRNAFEAAIFDLQLFHAGATLVASDGQGNLLAFDNEKLRLEESIKVSHKSIRCLARLAPDLLVAGCSDNKVRVLNAEFELLDMWEAHRLSVFRVLPTADGRELYTTGRDAHLSHWRLEVPVEKVHSVPAHLYSVNDLIMHPGGDWIFTASMDKSIKCWKREGLELLKVANFEKFGTHRHGVNRLLWLGNQLLSAGDDAEICRWEIYADI